MYQGHLVHRGQPKRSSLWPWTNCKPFSTLLPHIQTAIIMYTHAYLTRWLWGLNVLIPVNHIISAQSVQIRRISYKMVFYISWSLFIMLSHSISGYYHCPIRSNNSKDTKLMTVEEGLEFHSLSPGLMIFQPIPYSTHPPFSCWLKTRSLFLTNQTVGSQPTGRLELSCNSMTTCSTSGGWWPFFPIHKIGMLPPDSSCKSKENPRAKHKTDD